MLSTSDFSAAVGISESSVRRLADSGRLEIHRTSGGHRRIPVAEAIRYVRETGATVSRPELLGLADADGERTNSGETIQLLDALSEGRASRVIHIIQGYMHREFQSHKSVMARFAVRCIQSAVDGRTTNALSS